MIKTSSGNEVAEENEVFVCGACGRRSKDLFGCQKIDAGWDESCMTNAVLCVESSCVMLDGKVSSSEAVNSRKCSEDT